MGNTWFEFQIRLAKHKMKKKYKTKYGSLELYNRLQNCSYDINYNDYVFLKSPFDEKEFPCDFKIANILRYLWINGIITSGSNQPNDSQNQFGFIIFSEKSYDREFSIEIIESILGKKNILCYHDNIFEKEIGSKGWIEELEFKRCDFLKKNKNKIIVELSSKNIKYRYHMMYFSEYMLRKIYINTIKIDPYPSEEIMPGYLTCIKSNNKKKKKF